MPRTKKNPGFEKGLKRLEEIVGKLEADELTLEDSLKLFEEGVKLAGDCSDLLDAAEKKVTLLLKDREKGIQSRPFPTEEDDELN
ncbi:exodeoxyribonuclease VII small subunit [Dethiosulfatarculus sandiegensis]|uniref:Exodeoxyribonuclease 7 small subunit n=1 Tax=Dethiosulfatarculus sandiegensis TaxID=1429043 RepID=A0A0D2JV05_9BACT|nr:exodeoxyribonuclease VII small subunit [Dethiosulfatarculus sandiegensis]KIX13380.1 exodeoxyribonuclease VII small subunit [Dethiosulfatarculus sandiegensis]